MHTSKRIIFLRFPQMRMKQDEVGGKKFYEMTFVDGNSSTFSPPFCFLFCIHFSLKLHRILLCLLVYTKEDAEG